MKFGWIYQLSLTTLDSQSAHVTQQVIHRLADGPEPQYATALALNMPTQATKGIERLATRRERAAVYPVLMPWTREMAIQGVKRPESVVAEHTLICNTIPRPFCGDPGRIIVTIGDESWNGDYVIAVIHPDPSSDHVAIGTRRTRPALEVGYHCRLANKVFIATTALECARHIPGAMYTGVHVLGQMVVECQGIRPQSTHLTKAIL